MTGSDPLAEIKDYRRISEGIATAGQPTLEQLHLIAAEGFEVVINLGLHDAAYSLNDEQGMVKALGLRYEHIPVQWEQPTERDYQAFVDTLHQYRGQKQFIHCAANKRVSVFVALYQICDCGLPKTSVLNELESFWTPNEVWQTFITQVLDQSNACREIQN
jgi:protein tyrosine phosphatase (PTP) superfamily phosphohydrolase (DUF442 family)